MQASIPLATISGPLYSRRPPIIHRWFPTTDGRGMGLDTVYGRRDSGDPPVMTQSRRLMTVCHTNRT